MRSCNYVGVWYPEDPTHQEALRKLEESPFQYAYILHDKDTDEDGNPKKPHWHIVVSFPYQKSISAAAKVLGVADNYIQPTSSREEALSYLIHMYDPDKYQYQREEVHGTLATQIPVRKDEHTETERVVMVIDLIEALPYTTYTDVLRKVCAAGLYDVFRRMGSGALALVKDHNESIWATEKQLGVMDETDFERFMATTKFRSFIDGYTAKRKGE